MLFECALSSFHLLILVDCITRSWNITRNNINRAFSLFLGYAIDQHDARTQVRPTESFEKLIREVCAKRSGKACELFKLTIVDAWDKALSWIKEDDTAYVITGDIPLMWLRDSVAQVTPYLSIANDPSIQRLMEGLLRRIMVWIDMDPYVVFEREVREYDCLSV